MFSCIRLASDLLLWEPMAPSPTDRLDPGGFSIGGGLDLASQMLQAQGPDRFVMCRSGLRSYGDGNYHYLNLIDLSIMSREWRRTQSTKPYRL